MTTTCGWKRLAQFSQYDIMLAAVMLVTQQPHCQHAEDVLGDDNLAQNQSAPFRIKQHRPERRARE